MFFRGTQKRMTALELAVCKILLCVQAEMSLKDEIGIWGAKVELHKNDWTELPMPNEVINRINILGRRSKASRDLVFKFRDGTTIEDEEEEEDTEDDDNDDNNYETDDNDDSTNDDDMKLTGPLAKLLAKVDKD